jgi:hypothetical protein
MKLLLAILLILGLACTPPKKVVNFEYWQARLASFPTSFGFPSQTFDKDLSQTVVAELQVDEEGLPSNAKAIDGPEFLFDSAKAFLLGCRFHPSTLNGVKVKTQKLALKVQFNPRARTISLLTPNNSQLHPTKPQ